MMKQIFVLAVLVFSLYGCDTSKKLAGQLDTWIGSNKQSLILKWGPPNRTASDGSDGEVLIYVDSRYNPYNRYTIYDYRMMYAHADGEIYHWKTRSSATPPQQIDVYLR